MRTLITIQYYAQDVSDVAGRGSGNDLSGVMGVIVGLFACFFIYAIISDNKDKNKID